MPPVSRLKKERRRTFLREWRRFRNLTQERAAERLGIEQATLSRIERGISPYSQDFLEQAAFAYLCEPADLLMRNPNDPEAPWSIWDRLKPATKRQALALLKTLQETDEAEERAA